MAVTFFFFKILTTQKTVNSCQEIFSLHLMLLLLHYSCKTIAQQKCFVLNKFQDICWCISLYINMKILCLLQLENEN